MKAIKSNMKNQIIIGDRKILHCPNCDAECSGNAGDYWSVPEDYVFFCSECKCEMELVEKITTVRYI